MSLKLWENRIPQQFPDSVYVARYKKNVGDAVPCWMVSTNVTYPSVIKHWQSKSPRHGDFSGKIISRCGFSSNVWWHRMRSTIFTCPKSCLPNSMSPHRNGTFCLSEGSWAHGSLSQTNEGDFLTILSQQLLIWFQWQLQDPKLEVPTIFIRPIFQAYVSEYPSKIWPEIWYSTYILGSWNSHWWFTDGYLHSPITSFSVYMLIYLSSYMPGFMTGFV